MFNGSQRCLAYSGKKSTFCFLPTLNQSNADIEPEQCCIQEILCYLVMFIRAEPALFREMLRLRIGLIYEVMIFELSRVLDCESKKIHTVLFHQTIPCNIV